MAGHIIYDLVVIGGGPSGATAAHEAVKQGLLVALLDRAGRIKPCGGAIPPRCVRDFAIPPEQIVAYIHSARIISPSDRNVDMPIPNSYVGMVDREHFDEWLRRRAAEAGAERVTGTYESCSRDGYGMLILHYTAKDGTPATLKARCVIGADGAISKVAKDMVPGGGKVPYVFAYHEIIRSPETPGAAFQANRCDVYYRGTLSPDFYAWVFPHGATTSVGTGSAVKGFSLKGSVADLRQRAGLTGETLRREGAPIPLKPLKRWDNGRDVVLAGDAAGVVAPASGEGIYYAMLGGRLAADAACAFLRTGDARELAGARRRFMQAHGRVFWALGIMQYFWYRNDKRRERFVKMCADEDVQRLTWEAYTNKELVRSSPMAHIRVFFKDMAHLLGLARPT